MEVGDENCRNLGESKERRQHGDIIGFGAGRGSKNGVIIDKISLRDKSIAPYDGCLGCTQTGKCVIEDDGQEVYNKMLEAEGIVWATPVYFWSMTSHTKTLMHRTYALGFPKLRLANKVGGLITVAGGRGCTSTANIFTMYFNVNHMFFAEFAYGYAYEKGVVKKILLPKTWPKR